MGARATETRTLTDEVRDYWEAGSCGTERTEAPKFSPAYFAEIEEFRYRHEPFIHQFAQFTRYSGKTVLEVGVGAGTDFVQWNRAGALAHGVDLTDEAIENVRHRLALEGLAAADLRRCNAEHLPYPDDFFDLAYSWGVIHHAENTPAVLREIVRVTKPGGRVKLMVYNAHSIETLRLWLAHGAWRGASPAWVLARYQESPGTKAYTPRSFRELLEGIPHHDYRVWYWDQYLRSGARARRLRQAVNSIMPAWTRWFLAIEFIKGHDSR